ncbi:MAG TPA: DUF202 domain-containing protein [candidate division Zixibacteria bacterium]|nr:DUF202 domain-containing protein [candidate division Zixibacteria bacterium]
MDNEFDLNPKTLQPPTRQITHDRDAVFRLHLANQRTFLSYLRTALTFFVAGVSFIKFFDSLLIEILGWVFVPLGIITTVIGIYRYNRIRVRLRQTRENLYGGMKNIPPV